MISSNIAKKNKILQLMNTLRFILPKKAKTVQRIYIKNFGNSYGFLTPDDLAHDIYVFYNNADVFEYNLRPEEARSGLKTEHILDFDDLSDKHVSKLDEKELYEILEIMKDAAIESSLNSIYGKLVNLNKVYNFRRIRDPSKRINVVKSAIKENNIILHDHILVSDDALKNVFNYDLLRPKYSRIDYMQELLSLRSHIFSVLYRYIKEYIELFISKIRLSVYTINQ